jgi:hypothetical protein
MNSYLAYGLNIDSDINLSNLAKGSSSPDVEVRRGIVNPPREADGQAVWTTRSDFYMRLNGSGTLQVSHGRSIVVDADNADDRTAALWVLGPAMGVLLQQRGVLVLHASAVTMDGGVVAFLGHSGWGKSTMAAAMVKQGASAFCDDLVAVTMQRSIPTAYPGYPILKLGLDSGEMLGFENSDLSPVSHDDDRRQIAVAGSDPTVALPLARVYVLAEGDQPEVESLKPQDAIVELIRHSYASPFIAASGLSTNHLKSCAELVGRLPIRRIRRPRRLDLIHAVAELVRLDLLETEGMRQ